MTGNAHAPIFRYPRPPNPTTFPGLSPACPALANTHRSCCYTHAPIVCCSRPPSPTTWTRRLSPCCRWVLGLGSGTAVVVGHHPCYMPRCAHGGSKIERGTGAYQSCGEDTSLANAAHCKAAEGRARHRMGVVWRVPERVPESNLSLALMHAHALRSPCRSPRATCSCCPLFHDS